MSNSLKERSINSFAWKSAQSICSLGITFIIQLVLARMLAPEDFGIVAIATVFMILANTIIETSFSSAVIQRNELNQKLLSSVFFANLFLSLSVYAVLFIIAPLVAHFYNELILIQILRIQGLKVVASGLYSIPQAFLNRKMKFKELFYCNLIGSLAQALVGFVMAYLNAGVWALVISSFIGCVVTGVAIIIIEPWKPNLFFSFKLVKEALSFSSKILIIRVVRKLFYNIRVLAIGRVYNTETLGYFNKGFQFPSTAMTVVDGSITSVAFTSLSKLQNDREKFINSLRQYVRITMFICTPIMIGMMLIAKPLVSVLLTDKWIGCVPYLQIICLSQLFIPLNIKTTAFEALGKSDLSMKLHLSSILLSIILLVASIPFSPLVMTFSGVISNVLLQTAITIVTSKQLNYKIIDQVMDSFCSIMPTFVMILVVLAISFIDFDYLLKLCTQILFGITTFISTSIMTKNKVFYFIIGIINTKLSRKICQ